MSETPTPPDAVSDRPHVELVATEPETTSGTGIFDFDTHANESAARYQLVQNLYGEFASRLEAIVGSILDAAGIEIHTLESRGKDVESFRKKAAHASEVDPSLPKYEDPVKGITDLAGARIITFFLSDVDDIAAHLTSALDVIEITDKSRQLEDEGKFVGYRSVHYIVKLKEDRTSLPEYRKFQDLIGEIQVRTIMQHAWAEIEHDIQYKSVESLPSAIQARFAQLAGMLAIADREFEAIQDEQEKLQKESRDSVVKGRFEGVEITSDSLRAYLDLKLGSDGRVKDWSYQWTVRRLSRIGFTNLQQLEIVLRGVDGDDLCRKIWGNLQGQLTKFQLMVIFAVGAKSQKGWAYSQHYIERMKQKGIEPLNLEIPELDALE
jgi:putative GTP pyrophosphokinase